MSALARHASDYLRLRRALGFKLTRQGDELAQLVSFCDAADAATLTTDPAIAWARLSRGAPIEWAHRLSTARAFARYLAAIDPATEVPPAGVFPPRGAPPRSLPLQRQRRPAPARRRGPPGPAVASRDLRHRPGAAGWRRDARRRSNADVGSCCG
jgi:hypothetical protein